MKKNSFCLSVFLYTLMVVFTSIVKILGELDMSSQQMSRLESAMWNLVLLQL